MWLSQHNNEEVIAENYVLDVVELYKIDGNVEELFKKQFK